MARAPLFFSAGARRAGALVTLLTLSAAAFGCGPQYVRGTEIEFSEDKQALADLVERYRVALEHRDVDALRGMVSKTYYENGSTTDDPGDDYDIRGLQKIFVDLKDQVREIKLDIELTAIELLGDTALVDYDYRTHYLFTVGEKDRWATAADKNRLMFRREKGAWHIMSGL